MLAAALLSGAAAGTADEASGIAPSPAFTPDQLVQLPTSSWPTNGGNLYNQRYSPLTQLNRSTVKDVKAVWRASLSGSGLDPKTSGQAQILEWQGVLYVVTGMDDVFAIERRHRQGAVDLPGQPGSGQGQRVLRLGCARSGHGRRPASMSASSTTRWWRWTSDTGKVLWRMQSQTLADGGYSITMAPLYYDGMVIIGHSGGERGIRGVIKAFDAATGKLRWQWHTIPGTRRTGQRNLAEEQRCLEVRRRRGMEHPGRGPGTGPDLFPGGNPAPDLNGHARDGDNLFTASIVALDAKTGKYRWHYQAVHHDIWDYGVRTR